MREKREAAFQFQSTRPVKGATGALKERDAARRVSIHAPREGRDSDPARVARAGAEFQSTRPVKGATCPAPSTRSLARSFNPRAP